MPQPADHILVFFFAMGIPVLAAAVWFPLIKRSYAEGKPRAFIYMILGGVGLQWVLAATVLVMWKDVGRPLDSLGINAPGGTGFWISFAVFAGGLLFLVVQHVSVMNSEENQRALMQELSRLRAILPDTRGKFIAFMAASITAGVCEELLYRGVLTWYLSNYFPILAAYAGSTILFGVGHAYQGGKGMLQTAAMGAIFMALMHFSGSIWLSMLLHTAVDINSGMMAYAMLGHAEGEIIDAE